MKKNIADKNHDWQKVEDSILDNLEKSRVDSNSELKPGSIKLPYPYLSIAEGRNLLFYWDTYYTNLGILHNKELRHYAQSATDNLLYLVERLGYIPNSTEPWGLNRSQVPYLSMIVRDIYETAKNKDKTWLKKAYQTLKKEYEFWVNTNSNNIENHKTNIDGLQRYSHHASEEEMLTFFDEIAVRFEFGTLTRAEKLKLANDWLAEAEAGLDFTPRFENRCTDFIPICLNSNLYTYEMNFHWMVKELHLSDEPNWESFAIQRKDLFNKYLWNEKRGLYLDYDYKNCRHSKVASVINFYALWAGIASSSQAQRIVDNLSLFEYEYGITVCEKMEHERTYQWDYPAGWPSAHYYVVKALDKYGYKKEAARIARKYLDLVTKNFNDPKPPQTFDPETNTTFYRTKGKVYEKYNVVTGELYDAEYASNEFMGWSTGVFLYLKKYIEQINEN